MSSAQTQSYVDRWQDPARYDGNLLSSPREYLQANIYHTRRGPRHVSEFLDPATVAVPPLAPHNPDDSDIAMTEAPGAHAHSLVGAGDSSDIAMPDAPPPVSSALGSLAFFARPMTTSADFLRKSFSSANNRASHLNVHWTPPQDFRYSQLQASRRGRTLRPLQSAIKKRRAQLPEEHVQRLQWQSILDRFSQPHLADESPSGHFRSITEANTLANRPRNHIHDRDAPTTPDQRNPDPAPTIASSEAQITALPKIPATNILPTPPRGQRWRVVQPAKSSQPQRPSPLRHEQQQHQPSQPATSIPQRQPELAKAASQPHQRPAHRSQPLPPPPPHRAPAQSSTSSSPSSRKRTRDEMMADDRDPRTSGRDQRTIDAESQLTLEDMPSRRIEGYVARLQGWVGSTLARVSRYLSTLWAGDEYREDRIAVEATENRHKRRAVSPAIEREPPPPPGSFEVEDEPVDHDVHRQKSEARQAVLSTKEQTPIFRFKQSRSSLPEERVMPDGKTTRQRLDELTAEADKRGSNLPPDQRRRHGQKRRGSGRPARQSTQQALKSSHARDRRIGHLVERSVNIVSKPPRPMQRVRRGQRMHDKLRMNKELAERLAAAKLQEEAEEDAEWEAQVRKEEEADARRAAAVRPPLIPPLSHEWHDRLAKTLSAGHHSHEITTGLDGSQLYGSDFDRIMPRSSGGGTSSWLNDNAVNAFYASIVERKKAQTGWTKTSPSGPAFAAMNSQWLDKVSKDPNGVKSISRWSRRMGISGKKLLDAEHIFFPVNSGSHWTLLVISPKSRQIEYLDSMGGAGARYFTLAREWLAMELGTRSGKDTQGYEETEWTEVKGRSEHQDNMDDCGVFTCFNGLALAKGREFGEVTAQRMGDARRMMAAILINRGFDGEDFEL